MPPVFIVVPVFVIEIVPAGPFFIKVIKVIIVIVVFQFLVMKYSKSLQKKIRLI